jgi:hypothetical protein
MKNEETVTGTAYANSDGEKRRAIIRKHCRVGAEVILRREPDNPYDNNAIAVFLVVPNHLGVNKKKIGYIKEFPAISLAEKMDSGLKLKSRVKRCSDPAEDDGPWVVIEYEPVKTKWFRYIRVLLVLLTSVRL